MNYKIGGGLLLALGFGAVLAASQVGAQTPPGGPAVGAVPAAAGVPGAPGAPVAGRDAGGGRAGGGAAAPAGPSQSQVAAMQDALPLAPIAKPKKARKVLVFTKPAGFAHSVIPLAAQTVQQMGDKTGAWTATVSNDPADFNTANLAQFDAIVLDNTTGYFLDATDDPAATASRRAALLAFVRGGKGLVGLHSAADSYHTDQDGVVRRIAGDGPQIAQWPDFNTMLGAVFRWHWPFPQPLTVKIDDPKSPLTKMFPAGGFPIHDETYVFDQASFSRTKVHVLMSIDYSKMSDADKAKQPAGVPHTDGDYALSWIRRDGQGRVFYQALGHDEHVFAMPDMLQNLLAGIQYADGDLAADDSPSRR